MAAIAAATSAAPKGEPCEEAVPSLLGAPKPIAVFSAMREGLFFEFLPKLMQRSLYLDRDQRSIAHASHSPRDGQGYFWKS